MFSAVSSYDLIALELCEFLRLKAKDSGVDFGDISLTCQTDRGFYGVDSPPGLIDWFLDSIRNRE